MTTRRLLVATFALALSLPALASDVSSDRYLRAGKTGIRASSHATPTTTDQVRALASQAPVTCGCPRS